LGVAPPTLGYLRFLGIGMATQIGSLYVDSVKIAICRPQELGVHELRLWRKWQQADFRLASPFLAPEFAVAFAKHYEAARVAVLEDETGIVGFFPYEKHPLRVARTLAYNLSDCQAVICSAESSFDPMQLLDACGVAVLEFNHVVGHQLSQFSQAGRVELIPTPIVDLTVGFEEWLRDKRQKSSRIKQAMRKQRKLDHEIGSLDFEYDSFEPGDLRQLVAWKSAQYVRTGRHNRFADKRFRGFVEELLAIRTDNFQMRLTRLQAGGRKAALCLSLRGPDQLAYWLPTYDPDFAPYSPGTICLLRLIEAGANDGLNRLDLGKGGEDYKQWFKDFDDQVAEGWIQRQSPAALWRRVHQGPKRVALKVVLGNPRLRTMARSALNGVGQIRGTAMNAMAGPWSRGR
jgi:CelD/BcsL family acetyltransferase involved in cellulose biosynthesis